MVEYTGFDVAIVGSGATGGWVAKELTERGLRTIVLEAGPRITPSDVDRENRPPWEVERDVRRRPVQSRNRCFSPANCHLYVDDLEHPYATPKNAPFNWIRSRVAGGRTLLCTGVALRMSDWEFRPSAHGGVGPDWPIGHADLAPYYSKVERYYLVRGAPAALPQLPDSDFAGVEAWPRPFCDAVWRVHEELGIRLTATRYIDNRLEAPGGFVRRSSMGSTLADAERTGRLVLRTDATVTRLELDTATGRIASLRFFVSATSKGAMPTRRSTEGTRSKAPSSQTRQTTPTSSSCSTCTVRCSRGPRIV
jgi:choline dehydrogenase-like flavoprotein